MDLATTYMNIPLKNPLIASASCLTFDLGNLRQLEDGGAAAVVLPSLFEEQIEFDAPGGWLYGGWGGGSYGMEAAELPAPSSYRATPEAYLEFIRAARRAVDIPVIASLNGITASAWTAYAHLMQQAGAQAIELNASFVAGDPSPGSEAVEKQYVETLRRVKAAVTIPVAMKLTPFFTAPVHFLQVLSRAGANGFVLFDRFPQPDIDLKSMTVVSGLQLSSPVEIRLPLRWIALLYGRTSGSLAASTGVDTSEQVVKYLLAGADVVMTTSALLRHGIPHMRSLLTGLAEWLEERGIESIAAVRGQMSEHLAEEMSAYGRVSRIRALQGMPSNVSH